MGAVVTPSTRFSGSDTKRSGAILCVAPIRSWGSWKSNCSRCAMSATFLRLPAKPATGGAVASPCCMGRPSCFRFFDPKFGKYGGLAWTECAAESSWTSSISSSSSCGGKSEDTDFGVLFSGLMFFFSDLIVYFPDCFL